MEQIINWTANHTIIMIVSGGLVMTPFFYFMIDSLENPERYNHK
jgi:hypothetical protein